VPKPYRPGTLLYRSGLAVALAIVSAACHDDRSLGEIVDAQAAVVCAGAPCAGWCERPADACQAPTIRGVCRPFLTAEEQRDLLTTCAGDVSMSARVCGCDDRTFGNDCQRVIAGVSRFGTGACSGLACTGPMDCAAQEFCEFVAGSCQAQGTCQPGGPGAESVRCKPDTGAVCGCDGKTYHSECERRGAGVSKLRDGPCP
jgi:hypothetical protein